MRSGATVRGSVAVLLTVGLGLVGLAAPSAAARSVRPATVATAAVALDVPNVSPIGDGPAKKHSRAIHRSQIRKSATITVCASGCGFTTIQAAINAAASGDTISVGAGTYTEDLTISKSLTINGAGQASTKIVPSDSNPNPPGCASSLATCLGSSTTVIDVAASNVTLSNLTVDGNNPGISTGVTVGGSDIDARNGIVVDYNAGPVFNNTVIQDVTVQNIFHRGVYNADNGTFNFNHDTVDNDQGDAESIAMFNWFGSGTFSNNTVSNASDAIDNNWAGAQSGGVVTISDNTVTNSGEGAGTSNNQATVTMTGNTVSNCTAGGYGVLVFVPYVPVNVTNNAISGCNVGLSSFGSDTHTVASAPLVTFSGNNVDGTGSGAGSIGALVSTDMIGFDSNATNDAFTSNSITNFVNSLYTDETDVFGEGDTPYPGGLAMTAHFNRLANNSGGWFSDALNAITATNNWWGCNSGPGHAGCDATTGSVTSNPWLRLSESASTNADPGKTAVLTADITHNSNGVDTSGSGLLPDVTPVSFTDHLASSGSGAQTTLSAPGCQFTLSGCTVESDGTATSSELGTGAYTAQLTINWSAATSNGAGGFCAPATGPATLTSSLQKTLTVSETGTVCEVGASGANVPHTFTGTYTVTGGTGRFSGKSGSGTVTGSDTGTGSSSYTISGTLTDGSTLTGCAAHFTSGLAGCTFHNASGNHDYSLLWATVDNDHASVENKGTPLVLWAPHPVVSGQPLGAEQLDASANTAGAFAYSPGAGTVITSPTVDNLTFTPTDATDYLGVSTKATIPVNPAHTTIVAQNKSVRAGDLMPGFTFSTSPPASLAVSPTCSSAATEDGSGNDASPPGIYSITCSGGSDPNVIIDGYTAGTLTVTLAEDSLSYTGPTSGKHGTKVTVKAVISASSTAKSIESLKGLDVTFAMGNKHCTGTAKANGNVSCSLKLPSATGKQALTVDFAGDSVYQPAGTSHKINVK